MIRLQEESDAKLGRSTTDEKDTGPQKGQEHFRQDWACERRPHIRVLAANKANEGCEPREPHCQCDLCVCRVRLI